MSTDLDDLFYRIKFSTQVRGLGDRVCTLCSLTAQPSKVSAYHNVKRDPCLRICASHAYMHIALPLLTYWRLLTLKLENDLHGKNAIS